jgi:hypothetical protein
VGGSNQRTEKAEGGDDGERRGKGSLMRKGDWRSDSHVDKALARVFYLISMARGSKCFVSMQ